MNPQTYSIKTFIMSNGERYCLLIDKATGLPLYYPNLFVTTQIRNASKSLAMMEGALVSIKVLLSYCQNQNIDLESRFRKGQFLTPPERDSIRDFCQTSFAPQRTPTTGSVIPISSGNKKRAPKKAARTTVRLRLTMIARYLGWLSETLTPSMDRAASLRAEKMVIGLKKLRPTDKGRAVEGKEPSLTDEQAKALLDVIQQNSELNPFDDHGVRARNRLIVRMLFHLGCRGGELLGIRVREDIDLNSNQIVIARRADQKDDPRTDQPRTKTLDRRLPMHDELVRELTDYIVKYRSKVPGAGICPYLFVTHKSGPTQGKPMSISAYNKLIHLLAQAHPELEDLHGHLLRHNWNYLYSKHQDENPNPPSEVEQEKMREYAMGWKPGSGTATKYNRRFIKAKGMEASMALQKGMIKVPEKLKK